MLAHMLHILFTLLPMLLIIQMNNNYVATTVANMSNGVAVFTSLSSSSSSSVSLSDKLNIRHGRSKVRHSNEKEHMLRELRTSYGNNNLTMHDFNMTNVGVGRMSLSSLIPSGNGHLFGSDYWQNSDVNGTIINHAAVIAAAAAAAAEPPPRVALPQHLTSSSTVSTTLATATEMSLQQHSPASSTTMAALPPVTHKIRKLHKKKIMESIRKSVNKNFGLRPSKNHRSLTEAEQLQGRPTDDIDVDIDNELGEVMRLADELNLDSSLDMTEQVAVNDGDEDVAYQNDDEYITTAATPSKPRIIEKASSSGGRDSNNDNDDDDDDDDDDDNGGDGSSDELSHVTFAPALRHLIDGDDLEETNTAMTTVSKTSTTRTTTTTATTMTPRPILKFEYVNKRTNDPLVRFTNYTHMQMRSMTEDEKHQHELTDNVIDKTVDSTEIDYKLNRQIANTHNNDNNDDDDDADDNDDDDDNNYIYQSAPASIDIAESMENNHTDASTIATTATTPESEWQAAAVNVFGPNQLASTSVGGIALQREKYMTFEEIQLQHANDVPLDDTFIDDHNINGFPLTDDNDTDNNSNNADDDDDNDDDDDVDGGNDDTDTGIAVIGGDGDSDSAAAAAAAAADSEPNRFLAGVVDAANEDEIYDWDEISRNNRRNLMRGRDVVTKFLQIVETQHSLGSNCEAGTSLNLGEGVVDRYAQDRFRVEAEVAVNRANMLTRIFKMTGHAVQADVNLLHASVLSMVEFDDDIFAAGNCFDWNEHPAQPGLFCPFAYRLPPPNLGAIFAKDLATEYHYLGNTSEWFFQARKNAEKVIARNEQYLKAFHLYSNKTDERIEDDTLAVKYEDGRWSKPYYDCGGGNIWMLTYTVPFFGYENATYHFKGTSGIDIDLRRVDIDQCPQRNTPGTTQPLNIFAGTDKCKQRTTMCEALKGLGFRRGSYKCICRKGYYFPDTISMQKFFNGSLLEEEYEKLMLGKNSTYNIINEYECLPCAEGCDSCEDGSPCIAALNWPMRTSILVLACTVIGLLPPAAWFTFRYQQVKVVRAASPALLRVIALGAFFIYCTNIVMYPNPNLYTCTARIWLREIGFSLTYGALMLKTWRISVIFRVRSAKAVKITDAALLKRLGIICGVIGTCLLVRTLVSPPDVVVGRTADDLKAFLCKTDWWDYTFTSMEVSFLAWGVRLCIMVRKAPSEFNESRFISMAIYNEFLLTCFLNVSMLFLQSPANPDLLYIIFFCHTQLTVTLLLGLIFGSKVYIVLRSGKSHQESIGMGAKSSGAKFNFRPQVRTFANPSSVTTSTAPAAGTTSGDTKLSDQEALEEIRQLSMQLQRIQEMAPPKGVAVMTISSLLDGLKTPGGMMMVAAAATQATTAGNQLMVRQQQQQQQQQQQNQGSALPLLALNTEIQKYNQQLQVPQNNNIIDGTSHQQATTMSTDTTRPYPVCIEKAMNTELSGADFQYKLLTSTTQAHIICSSCLEASKEHYYTCRPVTPPTACQQMGSPPEEGSISFSNIKLECMCSQPDDLDVIQRQTRPNVRTISTNTQPSTQKLATIYGRGIRRRSSKTKTIGSVASLQDDSDAAVTYQICDKCKNKYNSSSNYRKGGKVSKEMNNSIRTIGGGGGSSNKNKGKLDAGMNQTRSNDILDRRRIEATAAASCSKKVHSTDDIIFYSTTDDSTDTRDDDDDDDEDDDESASDVSDQIDDGSATIRRRPYHHGHQEKQHKQSDMQQLQEFISKSTNALSVTSIVPCRNSSSSSGASNDAVLGSSFSSTCVTITTHGHRADSTSHTPTHDGVAIDGAINSNISTLPEVATTSSTGNVNGKTTTANNGRSKRPDKLVLDLNDRSKYTKEVSV